MQLGANILNAPAGPFPLDNIAGAVGKTIDDRLAETRAKKAEEAAHQRALDLLKEELGGQGAIEAMKLAAAAQQLPATQRIKKEIDIGKAENELRMR